MPKVYEGVLNGKGKKFAVVVSRFNELISGKLLGGAVDCLKRHEVSEDDIEIVMVPGAFEIPLAAKKMAETNRYSSVICLGAVIRGATPHFDYVSAEMSKGISKLNIDLGVPMAFGVLTTDNLEQALERAGSKSGNKGWDAALSALEMVSLIDQIQ